MSRTNPTRLSSLKGKEKDVSKKNLKKKIFFSMSIAPLRPKTQRRLEDRELNQARSKPDTVNRPVRTARIFVHHYNSTQYCQTETVFSIFPFLQTNITVLHMWPKEILLNCSFLTDPSSSSLAGIAANNTTGMVYPKLQKTSTFQ